MNTFKFFIYFVLLVLTLYSCNKEKEDDPLYDSAKNTNNSKASKIDASYLFDDNNYLIKGSDNIALFNFKEKLQTKSRNFLRLARNEIFARNGYIFKDSSLSFFFQSTGWYKPVSNFNPTNLSPIERDNIRILEELENLNIEDNLTIKFAFPFNKLFIVYVVKSPYEIEDEWTGDNYKDWRHGELLLLSESYSEKDLKSLPVEYFEKIALDTLSVVEEGRSISSHQIIVQNVDSGLVEDTGNELIIQTGHNSKEKKSVFYWLNKNNKLVRYFSIPSLDFRLSKISKSEIILIADRLKGYPVAIGYEQDYLINSIEKSCHSVESAEKRINEYSDGECTVICKSILIYNDRESAAINLHKNVIDTLRKGDTIIFQSYYQKNNKESALVKYDSLQGWINLSRVYMGSVIMGLPAYE